MAVNPDCASSSLPGAGHCVGCPSPDFVPMYDNSSQTYTCQYSPLPPLCVAGQAAIDASSKMALLSTWLGSLCPTTNIKDLAIGTFELADATIQLIAHPTSGSTGTEAGFASQAISFISSLAIGAALVVGAPEELGAAAVLGTVWTTACNVNSLIGSTLYLTNSIEQGLHDAACPVTTSKRDLHASASFNSKPIDWTPSRFTRSSLFRRQAVNDTNPCATFLSYFPTTNITTIPGDAASACAQIQYYDPQQLNNTQISNAVAVLQQFCTSYTTSLASELMMEFADVVGAFQGLQGYCTNDTDSGAGSRRR